MRLKNLARLDLNSEMKSKLGCTFSRYIRLMLPTLDIAQPSGAGLLVGTQMDSVVPPGSSWHGYRGLTGSASKSDAISRL